MNYEGSLCVLTLVRVSAPGVMYTIGRGSYGRSVRLWELQLEMKITKGSALHLYTFHPNFFYDINTYDSVYNRVL